MKLIIALCLTFGACATAPTIAPVESVGTLAPSYRSIATAPVHATTDLGITYQTVSVDDDSDAIVVTTPETLDGPDVATKHAHGF
jgi:hypothetical protein